MAKSGDLWWGIFIGMVIGTMMAGGGFAALGPLLKYLIWIVLLVLLFKLVRGVTVIRRTFDGVMGGTNTYGGRSQRNTRTGSASAQSEYSQAGTTIDICPKCGEEMSGYHRCKN